MGGTILTTQFDIPEVLKSYEQDRHYLVESDPSPEVLAVYFSSNGIYFPNDLPTFQARILEGNRFDWYKTRVGRPAIHVFVRDVLKTWYMAGVNAQISTVPALAEFLMSQGAGLPVVTVGSSAGGFAAILFGALLKADRVFAFNAQVSLHDSLVTQEQKSKNPYLMRCLAEQKWLEYFDLRPLVRGTGTPIYFFYPALSPPDQIQAAHVSGLPRFTLFPFSSKVHGETMANPDFRLTLNLPHRRLVRIARRGKGRPFLAVRYSRLLRGIWGYWAHLTERMVAKLLRAIARRVSKNGGSSHP